MSANFFTGYANDKPSSKVLNPPGGRSNNIFGGYEDDRKSTTNGTTQQQQQPVAPVPAPAPEKPEITTQQQAQANKTRNHATNIFGGNENVENNNTRVNENKPKDNSQSNIFGAANGNNDPAAKKRTGYNPITGKTYEEEDEDRQKRQQQQQAANGDQQQQNGLHTSSRVLQPPGGKSTKLW